MTITDVEERFAARAAGRPLDACTIQYPTEIVHEEGAPYAFCKREDRVYEKPLSEEEVWAAYRKTLKNKVRSDESYLKVECHPMLSIDAHGLAAAIKAWERDAGWVPDVVIIDYADNLAPVDEREDSRHQINKTWKLLRKLNQQLNCLMVTGTQAKATAYKADRIGREHFGDNKLKNAHVSGMLGISASPGEEEAEIVRLNWAFVRGMKNRRRDLHCATCFAVTNPFVKCTF
jgi:hypothetical protein